MAIVSKKITVLLLAISPFFLTACEWELGQQYDDETKTMLVDYYRQACSDDNQKLCFRARFDSDDAYTSIEVPFTGFDDYEWGFTYSIEVIAERDGNGKDTSYAYRSVNSKTASASALFNLTLVNTGDIISTTDNVTWSLANEKTFTCSDAQCTELINSEQNSTKIELSLNAVADVLTLNSIQCQAAENEFDTVCGGEGKDRWDIAHFQTECSASVPALCMLYREEGDSDDEWQVLPFDITDFIPQWGTLYSDMEVTTVTSAGNLTSATLKTAAQDSTEKTAASDSFKMVVRTGTGGIEKSSSGKVTYDGVEFDCDTNSQCDEIDAAIDLVTDDDEQVMLLKTRVTVAGETPTIVIEEFVCSDIPADFNQDCIDGADDVFWSL